MRYAIHQIQIRNYAEDMNRYGFEKAAEMYPEVGAYMRCALRGEAPKLADLENFTHTADLVIEGDEVNLEAVFGVMNGYPPEGVMYQVERLVRSHSLSVGDVVEANGEYYAVLNFGWEKIDV